MQTTLCSLMSEGMFCKLLWDVSQNLQANTDWAFTTTPLIKNLGCGSHAWPPMEIPVVAKNHKMWQLETQSPISSQCTQFWNWSSWGLWLFNVSYLWWTSFWLEVMPKVCSLQIGYIENQRLSSVSISISKICRPVAQDHKDSAQSSMSAGDKNLHMHK